jgi:hypothetical protein
MPPILALKSGSVGNVVIDGKQRICNLIKALESDSLTDEDRQKISNYEYSINHYDESYFYKDDEDTTDTDKIVDFFYKTNSMGTRLNAQEIRRALDFNKPYIKFVKKEKVSHRFNKFLNSFGLLEHHHEQISLRFLDEEFILKLLGFYYTEDYVRSPYTNMVIDTLVAHRSQKDLEESFGSVLDVFEALYSDSDTPKLIRFQAKYKGVMPIILGLLGQYDIDDIYKNRHKIGVFLNHFWFLRHDELAERFSINFNSGSGFYRAVVNLIIDKLDDL